MEIKQIEERIANKQAQIAKIQKRIDKWESAKCDKAFKKYYDYMCTDGWYYNCATGSYNISFDEFKAERYPEYEKECNLEIKRATSDLNNAQVQLDKYNNMLRMEQAKQDKLNGDKIQVIVDFLENWKVKATDFVHNEVKLVKQYKDLERRSLDLHYDGWKMVAQGEFESDEAVKAEYRKVRKEVVELKKNISQLAFDVYKASAKNFTDDARLSKILNKEADDKYLKLVDSITEKVGDITDTSSLTIGPKGDIEGYVSGTKGKVHVQTVGAGGYNIQCYHWRTLISPISVQ